MKRKSKVWNKFLVILLAVFSLSVLSPEMSAYLGNVQTVQAAKLSSKTLTLIDQRTEKSSETKWSYPESKMEKQQKSSSNCFFQWKNNCEKSRYSQDHSAGRN